MEEAEKCGKHGARLRVWQAKESDGDFAAMPYYHCSGRFEIFIAVLMKVRVLQYVLRIPTKLYFPYIMHQHFSAGLT